MKFKFKKNDFEAWNLYFQKVTMFFEFLCLHTENYEPKKMKNFLLTLDLSFAQKKFAKIFGFPSKWKLKVFPTKLFLKNVPKIFVTDLSKKELNKRSILTLIAHNFVKNHRIAI